MASAKILIVEDESIIALDLSEMLTRLGFTVVATVAYGEEVAGIVDKLQPDLLLMDIHLAGAMNGIEAAKKVLEHQPLPIIFLTAYVDERFLQEASVSGSFGYILKPFEERELQVNIDIALYKANMEKLLAQREEYYRTLIDYSNDIISIINPDGITRYVSPQVKKILGYQPEELVGRHSFELVHPDDQESSLSNFYKGMNRQPTGETAQFRFLHKDGSWRVMEISVSFLIENSPIHGIILNSRDITDRAKMAEDLQAERDKAQKYLDIARVMLIVLNERAEITLINPYALETLGYEQNEILGKNFFTTCFAPDFRDELSPNCDHLKQGLLERGETLEVPLYTKFGEKRIIAWRSAPLTTSAGHITSILFSGEDITEQKMAEARLLYNATHDPLTGLPNRAFFHERLAAAIERCASNSTHRFAVLFLDLDSFKLVNDSYGHTYGDRLLVAIARRVEGCLNKKDIVARLSGDEFFILLDDIYTPNDTIQVVERILQELATPLVIDGRSLVITCSIGVVLCNHTNQFVDDIIRDADIAMYQAKGRGKNGYAFFTPTMRTQPIARLSLENDLRRALEKQEFILNYQPILSIEDDRLVGFEALVRWVRPGHGIINPGDFIPILEETGLVISVGEWILNRACQQIQKWQKGNDHSLPLTISVNVSARQFSHPGFIEQVRAAIRESGIEPQYLILELTESVFLGDSDLARTTMMRLNHLGVRMHIDDFGTGYSSYSSLSSLPFDAIKIDRSFINKLNLEKNRVDFIRSILSLADSIGAKTIAEGVETAEQISQIRSMGCKYVQGFYISRPMSESDTSVWITRRRLLLPEPPMIGM